jgi:NADH dehydrogenase FAD-containing subunit
MRVIIVGCGYAGINAFHELKSLNIELIVISKDEVTPFWTSFFPSMKINAVINSRKIVERNGGKFLKAEVDKIDVENRKVFLKGKEMNYDYLIIAKGGKWILNEVREFRPSNYDYISVQASFALIKRGVKVKYCGEPMINFGKKTREIIKEELSKSGVSFNCEGGNYFADWKGEEFEVDEKLRYKGYDDVYVAGDATNYKVKVGELAMRTGKAVGKNVAGAITGEGTFPFKPIFVNIIDEFTSFRAIRIKSDVPFGGNVEEVSIGIFPKIAKSFIRFYYPMFGFKMGALERI